MRDSTPLQIALGFYDGPTEGFVRGLETGVAHYFKVVAWDTEQDRRLYLLGRVEEYVFDQLLALLVESGEISSSAVVAPAWEFHDAGQEASANKLAEEGRSSLDTPAFLAIGENLLGDFEVVSPTPAQLERALSLAQLEKPGDLGDWLNEGCRY